MNLNSNPHSYALIIYTFKFGFNISYKLVDKGLIETFGPKGCSNFIIKNSTQLQKKLLEHKILIRDCKNFRGLNNHHIRIAVKSHNDNVKLVKALEKIK